MDRVRVTATVDGEALTLAGADDAVVVDETEIDAAYVAYDEHPLDEPDEWGDLASFLDAAGVT
jgi:hypothetical protein